MEQRNDGGWEEDLTRGVGQRIALYRQRAGLTAMALSRRCTELGYDIGRLSITKLENGHRQTITVAEVFVLAAALEVPPVELLVPVSVTEDAELIPGRFLSGWKAVAWVMGYGPGDMPPADDKHVTDVELRILEKAMRDRGMTPERTRDGVDS